jgi:nitrogen regulatory protein PII
VLQLVTAVVKPHRIDAVKEALLAVGVSGMTVTEVKGFGRQGGHNTGKIGDGKLWLAPVDQAGRIRTGELDADAL